MYTWLGCSSSDQQSYDAAADEVLYCRVEMMRSVLVEEQQPSPQSIKARLHNIDVPLAKHCCCCRVFMYERS